MLEVSTRTVRQYKDELEKEGLYIESIMGKNGGYRLCSKVEIPSILFNKSDIDKIDLVLDKLSDNDKNELVSDKDEISIEDKNKIDIIQKAINSKKKITIEYYSKGIKKIRDILPIQIYVYENMIMVVVHYSDRENDIRHLNLKRIDKIII